MYREGKGISARSGLYLVKTLVFLGCDAAKIQNFGSGFAG